MADMISIVVKAEDQFSTTLGNFGNIITGIKSALDLVGDGFRVFRDLASEGLTAIASYERLAASLETLVAKEKLATGEAANMTEALAMSGNEAEELLKWNQELAINSPFTSEGVASAFRMAMAYGFSADESKRLTEAMIDFASGSGATEASMEAIARALGQISATGKVTGGDMMQLVNAGLPVVEILAEGFGVTTAELMDMRSKGLLPATEAIEYITTYLETNFAGAAERQATTWAGLQGTFEDLKTMGLREFFGGLFEALQPFAVSLSTWLQEEGIAKLGEWGDKLGALIQPIAALGEAFLDAGLYSSEFGESLTAIFGEENQQKIFDFQAALEKAVASGNWTEVIKLLDEEIANAIEQHDWTDAGNAFGDVLLKIVTLGTSGGNESKIGDALGGAFAEFFRGAVGDVWFENSAQDITSALLKMLVDSVKNAFIQASIASHEAVINFWINLFRPDDLEPFNYTFEMGKEIIRGFIAGMNTIEVSITDWFRNNIVTPIKQFLGIASPSRLFMDIGRNIIQGLIDGILNTADALLETIKSVIRTMIEPFAPLLDLLGIDLGSLSPSTGTVGGRTPSTTDTRSGVLSTMGTVTNNFYGPVYFGDMGQLGYECPSPHPLIEASGNNLVTNGIG